jgi:hypothetical protein
MNNQSDPCRLLLEKGLGKRISDSYWYKIKKWMKDNKCLNIQGTEAYLKRYAIPPSYLENTNKWLEQAPDKIKFTEVISTIEKVFLIHWEKPPSRTTIYYWFNSCDLGERFQNKKVAKHFFYTKTELVPVVQKVLSSQLIKSF